MTGATLLPLLRREQEQEEELRSHLELLPPELVERVCGLLPSSALHSLGAALPSTLGSWCQGELGRRHTLLEEGPRVVKHLTSLPHLTTTLTHLCPGLILLFCPSDTSTTLHLPHTITLQLIRPLIPSYSTSPQALVTPHFSSTPSSTLPSCYQICPLPLCDPRHSAVLYLLPSALLPPLPSWNICLPPSPSGLPSLLPPSFTRLSLPTNPTLAHMALATAIDNSPGQAALVVTDCHTEPGLQQALQAFIAKAFPQDRVTWLKVVFANRWRNKEASA